MSSTHPHKRAKTSPFSSNKRAVRIAGCSGGFLDRANAITRMAGDPEVDVVIGNPDNMVLPKIQAHHLQATGCLK